MKKRSTKRALLLSALSLLMCVSMLIGSTFAWFTDSVTSAGNKIVSGSLKVDLEMYNKETKTWKSIKEHNDPIFTYEYWEPGYVDAKLLKVENEGNLALKWKAAFVSDTALGILADVIDVFVKPGATEAEFESLTREDLATWTNAGTVREFLGGIEASTYGTLTPEGTAGATANLGIALKMREEAGNEYQEQTIGFFDIKILATQYTYEEDSFDEFYDNLADYDGEVSNAATLQAAFNQGGNFKVTEDFSIPAGTLPVVPAGKVVALDLNGKSITAENTTTEYAFNNFGDLTLYDSAAITTYSRRASTGSINARGIYNGYDPANGNVSTAKLTVLNGTYNAMGTNGGAAIYNYGIVDIKSGTFTSVGGYSLNNQSGAVMTVEAGVTANNGIYNNGATLTVNGGEFTGNRSGCHVLYCYNSQITVNGGSFYNYNGGNETFEIAGNTVVTVNGGTFGIEDDSAQFGWIASVFKTNNNASMTINDGTFNGSVKVYGNSNLTINGGTFGVGNEYINSTTGKIAISGGTFTNSKAAAFAKKYTSEGFQAIDMGNGSHTVFPAGYEMVADGVLKDAAGNFYIYNANGLAAMNAKMADKTAGKGYTVNLLADIDFSGKTWTTVDSHVDFDCYLKEFNGNGYTISNLTINGQAMFSRFSCGAGVEVAIKDITFDKATVNSGSLNAAIIVGQTYNNLLLDNVDVKNSTITGAYKVAPLIGTVYNESASSITATLKNCDVSNTVVTSTVYDFFTCGMVSFVYTTDNDCIEYENCTISDVQLKAVSGYYDYHANIHYTSADTDDQINEHPGVTVNNVTFENI